MRPLLPILKLVWSADRAAFLRGIALAVVVLVMGVALLGLSGWFIIAAGAAGLAGTGAVFDVFRPSAGVRFLALGRTAARYGERLLTHDATLKALAALRVRLLRGISAAPYRSLLRLRGAEVLHRLTADIDALDGVALRLAIPLLAGALVLAGSLAALTWLVDSRVAAWSVFSLALGATLALIWAARRSDRPSRMAEAAGRAFRVRLVDHLRGRAMLAFAGQLDMSRQAVLKADARARRERLTLARTERRTGAVVSLTATFSAAGALYIGAELALRGEISPALAALGFFATLGMAEVVGPLRRAMREIGGMRDSARRVLRWLPGQDLPRSRPETAPPNDPEAGLELVDLSVSALPEGPELAEGLSLQILPGETLALVGRSGAGKTTVLDVAAGLIAPRAGEVRLCGRALVQWEERALRHHLGYLPQRSALTSGTIGEALRLARPEASDAELHAVLTAVALDAVVARIGGLQARLGEGGRGLSGGESRRLALARVLLRAPDVLLLDEPTEGLDRATAERVLNGIRAACPKSAILIAAHRAVERDWADALHSVG
ncbi:amino acid ABC transporter ATP-binding/permease protein [Aliiruegeria sabulilitoris]|uniref:amino acid ABC transporter ATP-binding/permease protein n=1 Tax=Aliiruegeria sabulilitoris TaxID=1510458 RepID=UPI00082C04C2|nr:ATP-binding cassette domain-containing protein [Aliiruegeria sabulilitoris]NDR58247.1 ATP-binding cassette domain-containing protein [Pseudoruegeria sp. M32A2M]